jgi:hypothetical protein
VQTNDWHKNVGYGVFYYRVIHLTRAGKVSLAKLKV